MDIKVIAVTVERKSIKTSCIIIHSAVHLYARCVPSIVSSPKCDIFYTTEMALYFFHSSAYTLKVAPKLNESASTEELWAQIVELVLIKSSTSGAVFSMRALLFLHALLFCLTPDVNWNVFTLFNSMFTYSSTFASLYSLPCFTPTTPWISPGLFLATALTSQHRMLRHSHLQYHPCLKSVLTVAATWTLTLIQHALFHPCNSPLWFLLLYF